MWGSSLISRRLHYRGLQSLFLTKRKELWLCADLHVKLVSHVRYLPVVLWTRLRDCNMIRRIYNIDIIFVIWRFSESTQFRLALHVVSPQKLFFCPQHYVTRWNSAINLSQSSEHFWQKLSFLQRQNHN